MFRSKTNNLNKQYKLVQNDKVIDYGILYISKDFTTHSEEIRALIQKLKDIESDLLNAESYGEKLSVWHKSKIYSCSGIWLGDTSSIVEKGGLFGFIGLRPEPDLFISINPTTYSEILDFNLKNIASYTETIGSFEEYKANYLNHLNRYSESALFERKLVIDINEAENELASYESMGWYDISRKNWYESFYSRHDTLNKTDYEIWDLHKRLISLHILNENGRIEPPYLLYLLDEPADVVKAAEGYMLYQKIPFLKNLKNSYDEKVISTVKTNTVEQVRPPSAIETGTKLQWKGDKTDLAELIWALSKSGRIADTLTGQPVTQKELVSQIVNLLGLDSLDVANLMKGRYGTKGKPSTFKAQDGKTFVNVLQTLLDQRVID